MRDHYTTAAGVGNAKWIITEKDWAAPGWKRVGASSAMKAQTTLYNGTLWFKGGGVLFYSMVHNNWIYKSDTNLSEPHAARNFADNTLWDGDGWWASGLNTVSFDQSPVTFYPQGTELNNVDEAGGVTNQITLELYWPRWIRDDDDSVGPCGVYRADNGYDISPSVRKIGIPVWVEVSGDREFPRSLKKSGDRYKYGDIEWDDARLAYVLGDTTTLWWETQTAPTIIGTTVLYCKELTDDGLVIPGSEPDIELVFDRYEFGLAKELHYITEYVPWRGI